MATSSFDVAYCGIGWVPDIPNNDLQGWLVGC
jgi:hypothetical protein